MEYKKYLNCELTDDNTESGGVSFDGETLGDFLESLPEIKDYNMEEINKALVECGIEKIVQKN